MWAGIDPGKAGGVATIFADGSAAAWPMPLHPDGEVDVRGVLDMTGGVDGRPFRSYVAIEHVTAFRGSSPQSAFTFGKGFGKILGMLEALSISYEVVKPATWKKEMGVNSDKASSIAVAKRLYPDLADTIGNHDGKAEALLIATWRKRRG